MISSDNTRLSIDFAYEWESPDGTILTYQMKFMHGPWGPLVQISTNGDSVEFPAEMFLETSEFFITQGVMKGKNPVPVIGRQSSSALSMPIIAKRDGSKGPMGTTSVAPKNVSTNVAPFHSFDPVGDDVEEPEEKPLKKKMNLADRPPLTGKEGVTQDEAEEMYQQRMRAKSEAKVENKKIQKLNDV